MKKNKLYSIISLVVIFFIVLFLMRRETKKGKRKNKQNNSIEQFYTRDDKIHSIEYFRAKVFVELFNEISNKFEDLENKLPIEINYTGSSNDISSAAQDGNLNLKEEQKILRCMLDIYTYLKYKETNTILQIPLYRFFFDTIDDDQKTDFLNVTSKLTMANYKSFIDISFKELLKDDKDFTMGVLQQLEFYLSRAIIEYKTIDICNFITNSNFCNSTNSIYNFNFKDLSTLIGHENGGHLTNNVLTKYGGQFAPETIKARCYDSKHTWKRDYPVYKYLMYQMHIYKNNDDGKYFKYNWSEDITEAYKDSLSIYESMYTKIYNKYLLEITGPTFTDIYNILKEDLADLYYNNFDDEIDILKERFDGLTDNISTTQSKAEEAAEAAEVAETKREEEAAEAAEAAESAEAAAAELIEEAEAAEEAAEKFELQKSIKKQNYIEYIENEFQEIENKLVDLKNNYIYNFENDEEYEKQLEDYKKKKGISFTSNYNKIKQLYDNREIDASNIINRTYLKDESNYNQACVKSGTNNTLPIIDQIECMFKDKRNIFDTIESLINTDITVFRTYFDTDIKNSEQNNRKNIISDVIINKIEKPVKIFGNYYNSFFKEGRLDIGRFETNNYSDF